MTGDESEEAIRALGNRFCSAMERIATALEAQSDVALHRHREAARAEQVQMRANDHFVKVRTRELEIQEERHSADLWKEAAKTSMAGVWATMGALAHYIGKVAKVGPEAMGLAPEVVEAAKAFQEPQEPPP